jgi:hypothetical protein
VRVPCKSGSVRRVLVQWTLSPTCFCVLAVVDRACAHVRSCSWCRRLNFAVLHRTLRTAFPGPAGSTFGLGRTHANVAPLLRLSVYFLCLILYPDIWRVRIAARMHRTAPKWSSTPDGPCLPSSLRGARTIHFISIHMIKVACPLGSSSQICLLSRLRALDCRL